MLKKEKQVQVEKEAQEKAAKLDVFHQIDLYIKSKENKVGEDMPRIYRNMKGHLLAYQKARNIHLTFECFTLDFYEDLGDFLSYEYIQPRRKEPVIGLKINTVGKTIN